MFVNVKAKVDTFRRRKSEDKNSSREYTTEEEEDVSINESRHCQGQLTGKRMYPYHIEHGVYHHLKKVRCKNYVSII